MRVCIYTDRVSLLTWCAMGSGPCLGSVFSGNRRFELCLGECVRSGVGSSYNSAEWGRVI
jgi:hypothetical protein